MTTSELQVYLHENMPATEAMGVTVESVDADSVTLRAPFEPNRNHRGTLYGGSLVSVAIAAGWATVFLGLRHGDIRARLVIQRANMEYIAPGNNFFFASATGLEAAAWESFQATLARRGRSRLSLSVNVCSDGVLIATLDAAFVALSTDR